MCGVRPKFWEGGWIEMEKSKRTFRGSYPAYALTYFFFYWSLGMFTSVLSMYLTGIGKSKAEMSFYHVGFELVRRGADPDRGVYQ